MQILYAFCKLERQLPDSFFSKSEIPGLQVVKQVTARHIVQNNVIVVTVFEDVYQVYYVRVLTHL